MMHSAQVRGQGEGSAREEAPPPEAHRPALVCVHYAAMQVLDGGKRVANSRDACFYTAIPNGIAQGEFRVLHFSVLRFGRKQITSGPAQCQR